MSKLIKEQITNTLSEVTEAVIFKLEHLSVGDKITAGQLAKEVADQKSVDKTLVQCIIRQVVSADDTFETRKGKSGGIFRKS